MKNMLGKIEKIFLGSPLNPFNPQVRQHLALVALVAWVGLGADALSSSCYGPEETYVALGAHPQLALYIAFIMVFTIFIIALGYNQVIELFPSGGGGYKAATKLLHPYAGLVAGVALIVDYILTITVSIASGMDAIFSFLPVWFSDYKLFCECLGIFFLMLLNLRGMREAIQVLMPIFFGFIITHLALIVYGVIAHSEGLVRVIPNTWQETIHLANTVGFLSVIGIILHAYSLGSGTYTGLEAVSNNVQKLAEPRIQTGKRTMLYMAVSLSVMAGGIILLYLLWNAQPMVGKTLNAVVFHSILGDSWAGQSMLVLTLQLEAGLLFVAANTGFAAGPNALANMAVDGWVPNRFRYLSNRLVVQNGLVFLGLMAFVLLLVTGGKVSLLVVLYSINVFIAFTLALLGICIYRLKNRRTPHWKKNFYVAALAFCLTTAILIITIYYKFQAGGWLSLFITFSLVVICLIIRGHYRYLEQKLTKMDQILDERHQERALIPLAINPKSKTAVIFVNNLSIGMHTLVSVLRLFPDQFKNYIFLSVGVVDAESFTGNKELADMQEKVNKLLNFFVSFCEQNNMAAEGCARFGTDVVQQLRLLTDDIMQKYPNTVFFASQLIFVNENMITRFLHNHTPLILQHHLHHLNKELVILPMRI